VTIEADSVTVDAEGSGPREADPPVVRGTQLGRYLVLDRIGSGGMALVHAAYDPDLDRKVALKLLRSLPGGSSAARARTRLLREAQALAKLSHPHVVAIYDVGTVGEQVWIAMEFVDGPTLAAWATQRDRSWAEVLTVMLAAARGLASAHAQGILHRDLKPDNIMIGSDGRARVTDFGLARIGGDRDEPSSDDPEASERSARMRMDVTQAGAVLGTPAYMSPEQLLGKSVDAKSDQFSWCVTLWELLYGERPFAGDTLIERTSAIVHGQLRAPPTDRRVPAWLRRVCERGLALAPERRFDSMAALIAALEHGRAQARRRPWLLGLGTVLLAGAGVFAQRRWADARQVEACEAGGAEIESLWNDEVRTRLHDELVDTGLSFAAATAAQVDLRLEAQAQAWREHATAACLDAELTHVVDGDTHARVQWCLQERRLELASVLDQLREIDAQMVQHAVPLVLALGEISLCRDAAVLSSQPAPLSDDERGAVASLRSELAQVRAMLWAGRFEAAVAPALDVAARAQALGSSRLIADADFAQAEALYAAGRYPEAETAAVDAYRVAASAQTWSVAALAAELLIRVVGQHAVRPAEARAWALHAEIAAGLAGDPLHQHEVTRASSLGVVEFTAGDRVRARELFERANDLTEQVYGPEHARMATSLNNLANSHYQEGDLDRAIELARGALAIRERVLGPEHPDVASSLANLSVFLMLAHSDESALELQRRALAIRRAAFGPLHPEVATSLANLGALLHTFGRSDEAERMLQESIAVYEATVGGANLQIATPLMALGQVELEADKPDAAAVHMQRALELQQRLLGPEHTDVARTLHQLGRLATSVREYAKARTLLEHALAIEEHALPANHVERADAHYELGRALIGLGDAAAATAQFERAIEIVDANPGTPAQARFARFSLAQLLAPADRARAIALAERARDTFNLPGDDGTRAEIDAWLAAQHSSPARDPRRGPQ
jgi:tetratricopeptide (TPR) repeat protein